MHDERHEIPAFCESPETSVGIELEMPILDRESGELAPGATRILETCEEEGISGVTAELMQSMIEVQSITGSNVAQVKADLIPKIRRVRNIANSLGYDLALLATHPSARATDHVVSPDEHYQQAKVRMAWMIYHRVTFGMHVHIGVRSGDEAIGLINILVQYLPHLLAVSANSPFWQGIDTGLASARAALYGLVPHAGIPGYFSNWREFRNYCQIMVDCKAIKSLTAIKWDIRPRPDYGTIEVRVCDTPPTLQTVFALAALIRCLVISSQRLLEERPHLKRGDIRRQWIAVENKWLATRFGLDAVYIRTPAGKRSQLRHDLGEIVDRHKEIARADGDHPFLQYLIPVEKISSGAERQRHLYRETGTWRPLIDEGISQLAKEIEEPRPTVAVAAAP